ncbi:MAG: PepSY-associated TM helix domain-containing protein [Flavobacteriales bacterium]
MRIKKALLPKKRKKETWFKYIIRLLHLWLGLSVSIIVLIVCLTGSLYAFKNQINDLINHDKVFVEVPESKEISIAEIEQFFHKKKCTVKSMVIPESPNRSYSISFSEEGSSFVKTHYFNPYTLELLGYGDDKLESFFRFILDVHKTLYIPEIGKQVVGIASLIFCFLLLSGIILWIPKTLRSLKTGLTVKWKAKFHRINYDMHKTFGFYSFLMLLFIALTGLYITYPWMKNMFIVSLGGNPVLTSDASKEANDELSADFSKMLEQMLDKENDKETLQNVKSIPFDSIYKLSNKNLPYRATTSIMAPNEKDSEFKVTKINTQNWLGAMLPDELSFDKTGQLKVSEKFLDKPLHKQFIQISKPLHTGEILGWKSVLLYFTVSLIGVSLPITGFIIWWKKAK